MSADHDGAELVTGGPWDWTVENAMTGVLTGPVPRAPLDSGSATLVGGSGRSWNGSATGTPVLVPYSFATRDSGYWGYFGTPWRAGFDPTRSEAFDPTQRASVLEALNLWEQACGVTFIEVPDAPDRWFGGIRFQLETLPANVLGETLSWSSRLSDGAQITLQRKLYADDSMQPGNKAFQVLLHEIGHAIGLKHPFEGSPALPTIHDNTINTVMSYTDIGNYSQLGRFDIAAAQYLYGTQAAEDALAVRWSRGLGGALVSTGNDAANTITGLGIRDVVRAGGGNDVIRTQGGGDDILPGVGADTVDGGAGFDTVWAETPRRHATVVEQWAGSKALALPGGTDRLDSVETIRFFDGQLSFHADLPAGRVFRLYGAALGRAPDPIGFGQWAQELGAGAADLATVAARFAGSAEFAARYGVPDDTGFVSLLYANVLGRAPDSAGLGFWVGAASAGAGRAGVLLGFSESAEYKLRTAATYQKGLWAPDPEAVDVLRAYMAVLDRLPDGGGLASWTAAREGGMGRFELIDAFVAWAEFQGRFGHLSNRDFVEQMYRTALDRGTDPDGLAAWTHVLDAGIDSRSGVALGFADSAEMTAKLTPMAADRILLA